MLDNRRVLVTGGAGFIGSFLVEELTKRGANVIVADNFSRGEPSRLSHIEDERAPQRVQEILESDIREENLGAIAEARDRILNRYQIWPTVQRHINDLRR